MIFKYKYVNMEHQGLYKAAPVCMLAIVLAAIMLALSFTVSYFRSRQRNTDDISVPDLLKHIEEPVVENIKINTKRLKRVQVK